MPDVLRSILCALALCATTCSALACTTQGQSDEEDFVPPEDGGVIPVREAAAFAVVADERGVSVHALDSGEVTFALETRNVALIPTLQGELLVLESDDGTFAEINYSHIDRTGAPRPGFGVLAAGLFPLVESAAGIWVWDSTSGAQQLQLLGGEATIPYVFDYRTPNRWLWIDEQRFAYFDRHGAVGFVDVLGGADETFTRRRRVEGGAALVVDGQWIVVADDGTVSTFFAPGGGEPWRCGEALCVAAEDGELFAFEAGNDERQSHEVLELDARPGELTVSVERLGERVFVRAEILERTEVFEVTDWPVEPARRAFSTPSGYVDLALLN